MSFLQSTDPTDAAYQLKAANAMVKQMELSQNVIELLIVGFDTIFTCEAVRARKKPRREDGLLFEGTLSGAVARSSYDHIPDIVVCCVEYLTKTSLSLEGLFRVPGNNDRIQVLRDQYETGKTPTLQDGHCAAGVLKLYFRLMFEPIFPFSLYNKALQVERATASLEDKLKMLREVVAEMPLENQMTLNYLLHFLTLVVAESEANLMGAANCAMVFAPSLLRSKQSDKELAGDPNDPIAMISAANELAAAMERSRVVIQLLISGYPTVFPEGPVTPTIKTRHSSTVNTMMRVSSSLEQPDS